ncbi:MAG: thiamine phosphate synthase, partial [Planctomycetaceae bacterium]|nr:thiamine phosphate synthase [Planctomycetaceae bacterium]
MRFDLTNASYRVLDRASKYRFPATTSEISAAKILVALFKEEESRAADWLGAAGLSLEKFCTEFGVRELFETLKNGTSQTETPQTETSQTETLQSPISAPSFPVGYYGIPAGLTPASNQPDSPQIEASPAGNNASRVKHPDSETFTDNKHKKQNESQPEKEFVTDTWNHADSPIQQRTYSIYPQYRNDNSEPNFQSRIRFYLDDQLVHPGRISKQLESALEIILHRFSRQDIGRLPVQTNGGITTIANRKTADTFLLATEHLLLAVVLDDSDVGFWLRDHGFDPTELYQRIDGIGNNYLITPETTEPIFNETNFSDQNESVQSPDQSTESLENAFSVTLTDGKIYRLLDATANRGKEAVRVIEDFVRFVLDDLVLTRQLKDFRHEFQDILNSFPTRSRLSARNTEHDVGTVLEGNSEYQRNSTDAVLAANFGRLQESLRSLEEFSKLIKPEISRHFERLRYQCYTLQKVVTLNNFSPPIDSSLQNNSPLQIDSSPLIGSSFSFVTKPDISMARLYVLTDIRADEEEFTTFVRAIIEGGADVIQLRDKKADDRTLLHRSRILKEQIVTLGRSVLFVMNDRPDLARVADADGVHIGQEELPVDAVRRIVGTEMLIGVSTHCIEQARQAVLDGADYIGAGPVFETLTKEFTEIAGTGYLQEVATEIQIPVFAIGGITAENLE